MIKDPKMEENLTLDQWIAKIKDQDDKVRAAAWLAAGEYGAAAVRPLAAVMTHEDIEVARAAKRAMWVIVRHVGRPGADDEKKPAVAALCTLLGNDQPDAVRREVLWMLSEIGGDDAVEAIREIPQILELKEIREDARCAVERIPGDAAVRALADGLEAAPDDFKLAIVQSLRVRGVEVDKQEYPCQKLVPTKQTEVEPAGR
jgi:hypothetical protein